jgi:hypothetical protein
MSKYFPFFIFIAMSLCARLFLAWAVGDGFETRVIWTPFVYSAVTAGLILSSLIAVGLKDSDRTLVAVFFVWLFQWIALGAVVLREPGHALAAERLHGLFGIPAFAALFLFKNSNAVFSRGLCAAAWLIIGAAPPLPGFFAHIEVLSALINGRLHQLAALTAFSQVCLFYVASRELFAESGNQIVKASEVVKEQ